MNRRSMTGSPRERAVRAAQQIDYELQVREADVAIAGGEPAVVVSITNRGVAPFYTTGQSNLACSSRGGSLAPMATTLWRRTDIQPVAGPVRWQQRAQVATFTPVSYRVLLRVPNPMVGGKPLRFANQAQDRDRDG